MNVKAGELAVVVRGLWPNVGRIVYVDRYLPSLDFRSMGLDVGPGWRVRSWSRNPLETTDGNRFVGFTPVGSLKPLDHLPDWQQLSIQREMAVADFRDAMDDLAKVLQRELETQPVP